MAASHLLSRLWLVLLVGAVLVAANTEKAIFVAGPPAANEAGLATTFNKLPQLTPSANGNAWRTGLPAVFPWAANFPLNGTTWVLLDDLTEGQRYELRVCWAATQPTEFGIDVFEVAEVASTPELADSLLSFVERYEGDMKETTPRSRSMGLLRIVAAADFVAADRSAMRPDRVPPVLTDIILDPYLLNAVPRSLLPVVAAILAVASVSAWLARRVILPQLRAVVAVDAAAGASETKAQKVQKKNW